jgi:hypothetical protein
MIAPHIARRSVHGLHWEVLMLNVDVRRCAALVGVGMALGLALLPGAVAAQSIDVAGARADGNFVTCTFKIDAGPQACVADATGPVASPDEVARLIAGVQVAGAQVEVAGVQQTGGFRFVSCRFALEGGPQDCLTSVR